MGLTVVQEREKSRIKVKAQNQRSFRNSASVPPSTSKRSFIDQMVSKSAMVSPGDDIENQLSGVNPDSPAPKKRKERLTEDALFLQNIENQAHRKGCFSCIYSYILWALTLFGIPKLLFKALKFLTICSGQALYASYAYVVWECCGIPVSKMNKNEYLLSRYMDLGGNLMITFQLLRVEREEQLKWMGLWSTIDVDGDDRMDINEFHQFFDLEGIRCDYTERMFRIFNIQYNGYINFKDFFTTCWEYVTYDKEKLIEISFRLLSRRGDTFDPERTCLDVTDMEHFVKTRFNKDGKKSEKWVKKYAVYLYAEIDEDETGGISYTEFKSFCEKNDTMLLYGFWFQSHLRKMVFGEEYWREATEKRPATYKIDHALLYKLMGDLDWTQIYAMGFAPVGSMVPKKDERHTFQSDFYDAYVKAKEKKLLDKQNGKKREAVTSALAAMTHKRCIAIFSKIVPDVMTVGHAFARWKDVFYYEKSIELDDGDTYRMMNMSLMDIRTASTAASVGKSTRKLEVALLDDFEAEAVVVGDKKGKKKHTKKAKKMAEKRKLTEGVLREIAKNVPTDDDIVADAMKMKKMSLHHVQTRKVPRIISGPALASIKNVLPEVQKRKKLRDGLEKHFADILDAREKENERMQKEWEEEQRREFEESPLRRRITDRFGDTIEGGFELVGMTSLKALENVRMLSNLGASGYQNQSRRSRNLPR